MLVIVEQLREGKLMLVLIGYHYYSVQFYLVQLLVSATGVVKTVFWERNRLFSLRKL